MKLPKKLVNDIYLGDADVVATINQLIDYLAEKELEAYNLKFNWIKDKEDCVHHIWMQNGEVYLDGEITELRYTNKVLSKEEVQTLYEEGNENPTPQERLSENANKLGSNIEYIVSHPDEYPDTIQSVLEAIKAHDLHTIEQTIKEERELFKKLLDRYEIISTGIDSDPTGSVSKKHIITALTDTQHALRGIIKE